MRFKDLGEGGKKLVAQALEREQKLLKGKTAENDSSGLGCRSFVLKTELVSQNNGRGHHWSKSNELKQHYLEVITYSGFARDAAPEKPQKLTITRVLGAGQKEWDLPNIPLACKELIDALVDTNNLKDDKPANLVDVLYRQDKSDRSKGSAIKIELEDEN